METGENKIQQNDDVIRIAGDLMLFFVPFVYETEHKPFFHSSEGPRVFPRRLTDGGIFNKGYLQGQ